MSAKSQFLKKLQARQSLPGAFESKSQADIAAFRQGMALLQEQMAGWLEDTGISVQCTRKSPGPLKFRALYCATKTGR